MEIPDAARPRRRRVLTRKRTPRRSSPTHCWTPPPSPLAAARLRRRLAHNLIRGDEYRGNGIVLPESARCCRGKVITLDNYRCPSLRWGDVDRRYQSWKGRWQWRGRPCRCRRHQTASIPVVTRRRETLFPLRRESPCLRDRCSTPYCRKVAHDGVAVLDRAGHDRGPLRGCSTHLRPGLKSGPDHAHRAVFVVHDRGHRRRDDVLVNSGL